MAWHPNHPPCDCGCGELADECAGPQPNPLGSMRLDPIAETGLRNVRAAIRTRPGTHDTDPDPTQGTRHRTSPPRPHQRQGGQAVNDIHLIQYDDGEGRISMVLCAEHRPEQFAYLKKWGIGCIGMPAPTGAECDNCETEAQS